MPDLDNRSEGQSPTLVPTMIWAALLISQLTYVMVATQMVARRATQGMDGEVVDLKTSLGAVALVVYLAGIFLPQVLWKTKKGTADPLQAPLSELTPLFFVPFIIRLALFEAVTLLGFVLVIAGREPVSSMLPFMGASLVGYLLSFPSESKIRSVFKPSGATII